MKEHLIEVKNLSVHFPAKKKGEFVYAVNDLSLKIFSGETLGLVGESGCGKSTTGRAILQLIRPTSGEVIFDGIDLTQLKGDHLRMARSDFQIIFQDPFASLNPRMTVGDIVGEPFKIFGRAKGKALEQEVQDLLKSVGLNPKFVRRYPHEFSGGQRQRVGIARALALKPKFIVADEPISSLDVSIQAQILNLLMDLKEQYNLTLLFIAHDLAAVRHISHRVAVMYLGRIVELADRDSIYQEPLHPYTQALLSSIPIPHPKLQRSRERIILQGEVPSPIRPPGGCSFHTRCPQAMPHCSLQRPTLKEYKPNHFAACHLYEPV